MTMKSSDEKSAMSTVQVNAVFTARNASFMFRKAQQSNPTSSSERGRQHYAWQACMTRGKRQQEKKSSLSPFWRLTPQRSWPGISSVWIASTFQDAERVYLILRYKTESYQAIWYADININQCFFWCLVLILNELAGCMIECQSFCQIRQQLTSGSLKRATFLLRKGAFKLCTHLFPGKLNFCNVSSVISMIWKLCKAAINGNLMLLNYLCELGMHN